MLASAIAFGGLHIWEIADAFVAPIGYNEHVHELRRTYGYREPVYARITPYVSRPQASDSGMTAGLSLRF